MASVQPQEYYLELLSTSNLDRYPDNRISHFTTLLHTPLTLPGQWVMGLQSCGFQNNVINVEESQGLIKFIGHRFIRPQDGVSPEINTTVTIDFSLPVPGNYSSPTEFVKTVHNLTGYDTRDGKMWTFSDIAKLEWNPSVQKLNIRDVNTEDKMFERATERRYFIFQEELGNMIGLEGLRDPRTGLKEWKVVTREFSKIILNNELFGPQFKQYYNVNDNEMFGKVFSRTAMWNAHNIIYILCDRVEPSSRGNDMLSYLAAVPITVGPNEYEWHEFRNVEYKKVNTSHMDTVTLTVVDQDDERVKFLEGSGEVHVKLHLKRVQ